MYLVCVEHTTYIFSLEMLYNLTIAVYKQPDLELITYLLVKFKMQKILS